MITACLRSASPRGLCCSLEKLSDALPLCFILCPSVRPSVCVSLSSLENTNRGAAFVRHKSPLPLKLPAPLFSCPNSTAIKLSWQAFRKQLRREKDGGGGGGGGGVGGVGGHSTLLNYPPSSLLWISQICARLPTTLNKDLTSFLFSLLIRFPQKCLLVFTKGQDEVGRRSPLFSTTSDMSVSVHSQSSDDINHGQISLR